MAATLARAEASEDADVDANVVLFLAGVSVLANPSLRRRILGPLRASTNVRTSVAASVLERARDYELE